MILPKTYGYTLINYIPNLTTAQGQRTEPKTFTCTSIINFTHLTHIPTQ